MSDFLDLGSEFATTPSSAAGTVSDIDFDRAASAFLDISLDGDDFSAFYASGRRRQGDLVLMILEAARGESDGQRRDREIRGSVSFFLRYVDPLHRSFIQWYWHYMYRH
jgi:hypothetical protein